MMCPEELYKLIIPFNLSHMIVPKYCYVGASLGTVNYFFFLKSSHPCQKGVQTIVHRMFVSYDYQHDWWMSFDLI